MYCSRYPFGAIRATVSKDSGRHEHYGQWRAYSFCSDRYLPIFHDVSDHGENRFFRSS